MNNAHSTLVSRLVRALAACTAGFALGSAAHAAFASFTDTFDTWDTSTWTASSGGTHGYNPGASGGSLRENTTVSPPVNGSGDHAEVTSVRDDFNPFNNGALQITLNGISLAAQANAAYAVGSFYVGVGDTETNSLPGAGKLSLSINIEKGSNNAAPAFYTLRILDGSANVSIGQLSAVPSDVVWTIDGSTQTWSVVLTGASFTTGAFSGASSANGTFSNFTTANVTDGSQLFLGVKNATYAWAQAAVSSVSVTAIPEPATAALLVGGAILLAGALRRKR